MNTEENKCDCARIFRKAKEWSLTLKGFKTLASCKDTFNIGAFNVMTCKKCGEKYKKDW